MQTPSLGKALSPLTTCGNKSRTTRGVSHTNTRHAAMRKGIYAVIDTLARDVVGGLHLHTHEATAIRFFSDIATMPNSQIALHPGDYELVRLGWLDGLGEENIGIITDEAIILNGATWAAAQQQPTKE